MMTAMHLNYRDAKPTHERKDEGSVWGKGFNMSYGGDGVGQVVEQAFFIACQACSFLVTLLF